MMNSLIGDIMIEAYCIVCKGDASLGCDCPSCGSHASNVFAVPPPRVELYAGYTWEELSRSPQVYGEYMNAMES